jgi:type II secretory pathway component PulM
VNFSLQTMNERERRMVIGGAIAAVIIVIAGVLVPLNTSVGKAHDRVAQKQADLSWMRAVGPELQAAGPVAQRPPTQESLLVVVDRAARESGLGSSLTSSEPSGPGRLRVRLEKASFDVMVGWLGRISDQHGITVESATVDNAGAPGIVNAGLVLQLK